MSLVVWLPLTKDLRQQGLSNVEAINSGATYSSTGGKLGGCYSFDGTDDRIYIDNLELNNSAMSACCWVKLNNLTSSNYPYIFALGSNTSGTGIQIGLAFWKSDTKIHLVGNGSEPITTYTPPINTWIHLCITIKGSESKLYVNGELIQTVTNSNSPKIQKYLCIGARPNSTSGAGVAFSYPISGYINDFRLYDHCLSSMEIKQLSQGLVLHYPLNREGWGQENLLLNSTIPTSGSGAAGVTKSITEDGLQKVVAVSGNSNWCTFNNHNTTLNLTKGDTFTFSLMIKSDDSTKKPTVYFQNGLGYYDMQGTMSTNWSIIYYTGIWNIDNLTTNIHLGFSAAPGTYYIKYFKIEKGDKITPWAPNHTDDLYTTLSLDEATEYDCSGFCNNGTRTGTFTWDSNTAKYSVSQIFNGTNNAIQTPSLPTMVTDKNYTIACWTYKTVIGTKNYQTIYGGPSGFELEARSSSSTSPLYRIHNWGGGTTAYNFGEWTHFCFVHTDSNSKLYVNGELKITGTSKNIPSGNYFIGAWNTSTSQNYEGLMSDFRIYATALSADDVRALYENYAYIDNSGNTYAATYTEV